jgi:hypothetical protein
MTVLGPRDEDYGKREGQHVDPDGNVIKFDSPIRWLTDGTASAGRANVLSVDVRVLYFDGCPNWQIMQERVHEAMREVGLDAPVALVSVDTVEQAECWQFRGSPSLLLNGNDPFADRSGPVGLSYRIFHTQRPSGSTNRRAASRGVAPRVTVRP